MTIRIVVVLLVFAASTASGQTSYYKCTDERGRPIFSQRPCDAHAETGTVQGPQHTGGNQFAPDPALKIGSGRNSEAAWDRVEASNLIRDAERQVKRREDHIARLEAERDGQIAVLKDKKRFASNNLAGATWEDSLSSEMQVINDQYQSKIESEQRKIDRLHEQIARASEAL